MTSDLTIQQQEGTTTNNLVVNNNNNNDDDNKNNNNRKCIDSTLTKKGIIETLMNRIDKVLSFYVRFVSTATNQDKILKLLQWTFYIAAITVSGLASSTTSTSTSTSTSIENKNCNNEYLSEVSIALRKLYVEFSMARYVTRLLGFPIALHGYWTDSWSIDTNNTFYKWIGRILSSSMILYYPTEALAYTHWMVPKLVPMNYYTKTTTSSSRSGNYWSYISCRFWVIYIITELTQNIYQWNEIRSKIQQLQCKRMKQQLSSSTTTTTPTSSSCTSNNDTLTTNNNNNVSTTLCCCTNETDDQELEQLQYTYQQNQLQTYRNLLFLLPCINWSLPNWDTHPWLSEKTNNTLMWLESLVSIYQAIIGQK